MNREAWKVECDMRAERTRIRAAEEEVAAKELKEEMRREQQAKEEMEAEDKQEDTKIVNIRVAGDGGDVKRLKIQKEAASVVDTQDMKENANGMDLDGAGEHEAKQSKREMNVFDSEAENTGKQRKKQMKVIKENADPHIRSDDDRDAYERKATPAGDGEEVNAKRRKTGAETQDRAQPASLGGGEGE